MTVVSLLFFVACGGAQSVQDAGADAGQQASCSTRPFGVFAGSYCDGGTVGTFTFQSDAGVAWQMVGPYSCFTDSSDCALVMTCPFSGSSSYVFDLQSSQDARQLSGTMMYEGRSACVVLAK